MVALEYNVPNIETDSNFDFSFKPTTSKLGSYKEEIISTVKYISENTEKPIYIAFSGGIDSEIIVNSFMECKIPFTVVIFRYPENINFYDIQYAIKFCTNNFLKFLILDIDPLKIYENFLIKGKKFLKSWWDCTQAEMIRIIDEMGGCAILGCGLRDTPFITVNEKICIKLDTNYFLMNEWCKHKNATHFPYFYQARPEIFASFLKDPLIDHLLSEPNYFKNRNSLPLQLDLNMKEYSNPSIEKLLISYKFWPEMERRTKVDGYEKLRTSFFMIEKQYEDINRDPISKIKPVDEIKKELNIV